MSEQENVCLWKLYLRGRRNEYRFIGFIWAKKDAAPNSKYGCTKWRGLGDHLNLCADVVQDTSNEEAPFYWSKPWPKKVA